MGKVISAAMDFLENGGRILGYDENKLSLDRTRLSDIFSQKSE